MRSMLGSMPDALILRYKLPDWVPEKGEGNGTGNMFKQLDGRVTHDKVVFGASHGMHLLKLQDGLQRIEILHFESELVLPSEHGVHRGPCGFWDVLENYRYLHISSQNNGPQPS
jgi:hypothetical protein